jgi:hypothetical protein
MFSFDATEAEGSGSEGACTLVKSILGSASRLSDAYLVLRLLLLGCRHLKLQVLSIYPKQTIEAELKLTQLFRFLHFLISTASSWALPLIHHPITVFHSQLVLLSVAVHPACCLQ